ncbi:MAG: hypothetical protein AAF432_07115 [Planctomycetota bacterium]
MTYRMATIASATIVSGLLLAGCSSKSYDPYDVSWDNLQKDLSPELRTETERNEDIEVALSLMEDQNERMFWGDLGRAFHTDHPSRLSPFPVPGRTGRPR